MGRPVFTLSCPDHCRTNGDLVVGTVNLDLDRAKRKQVVAVKVSLVCETIRQNTIPRPLTYQSRLTNLDHHDTRRLVNQQKIVWKQFDIERDIEEEIIGLDSGTDSNLDGKRFMIIPFLFHLPTTPQSLLPSSTSALSTTVSNLTAVNAGITESVRQGRYYLRVEGQRKYWYLPKISVMRSFPVFASHRDSFAS